MKLKHQKLFLNFRVFNSIAASFRESSSYRGENTWWHLNNMAQVYQTPWTVWERWRPAGVLRATWFQDGLGWGKQRKIKGWREVFGWLVGWLCGWLASCLVHWLAIKLVGWSVSWLVSWLAGWLISCMLAGCWLLHDSFVAWLVSWLDGCLCRWINK